MGRLPRVNHLRAIRAFERAGFEVLRQSGHVFMSDGRRSIVIPRTDPIDPITMFGVVRDAELTVEPFRKLL